MTGFLSLLKLVPGAGIVGPILSWLWSAIIAALRWVFSDWRHFAIVALALCLINQAWRIEPSLRQQLAQAQSSALAAGKARDAAETSLANVRAASATAEKVQAANLSRVQAEQAAINERTVDAYQARIDALRARAAALSGSVQGGAAAADPGLSGADHMPGTGRAASGAAGSAEDYGFSSSGSGEPPFLVCSPLNLDQRLIASEQAEQLNALIDWAVAQAEVRNVPQ